MARSVKDCQEEYHYSCSPQASLDVHGGVTFSSFCAETDTERGICHVPAAGEPDRVWWIGFDCSHLDDLSPGYDWFSYYEEGYYKDINYVTRECASLAEQLACIARYREE